MGSGDGGQVGVAGSAEGLEGAVTAAADGAFVDAEGAGHVVAGCVAVASAGFEVEEHQEVLEWGDAVAAGPEQQVDDVDVSVVRAGGVDVLESRILGVDEQHLGLAGCPARSSPRSSACLVLSSRLMACARVRRRQG